jgi:hypothetical protein
VGATMKLKEKLTILKSRKIKRKSGKDWFYFLQERDNCTNDFAGTQFLRTKRPPLGKLKNKKHLVPDHFKKYLTNSELLL